ncbi:MAG: aldo/keto reductase [Paludibacteraceae bacterium]|nr:aldo/keto reductase [Paludibacteraceae bacterium]
MDRREFITTMASAAAVTGIALSGCRPTEQSSDNSTPAAGEPQGEMEYRQSSKGDKVSLLGYGTMRWPSRPGRFKANENEIDQETVNRLVDEAISKGVNFFDSSPVYCKGFSEEATGIALSRYPRESYLVSTKLSNFSPSTWSYEESVKMYHESMRKLRVDYLDYYLLHSIGGGEDAMQRFRERYIDNGVLDFLLQEREAGRIRHLGFSYHGDVRIFDWAMKNHQKYHWDMVLIQMNYVDWHYAKQMNEDNTNAEYLYSELEKRHIPAMIMEPLLGGQLALLPTHATRQLKNLEPERSIASWAFRWAGSHTNVMTVLSGMTYMNHLKDNLRTFCQFKPLNDDEMQLLEKIAEEYAHFPLIPCTSCQYCMPCPYGIDIPGNFRLYNSCLNEGLITPNQQDSEYRKLRWAYLRKLNDKLERERQADHCINCGICQERCPQHIDIPAQMDRINHYIEELRENVL